MKLGTEFKLLVLFSSVQSLSRVQLFAIPWTAARQASLSITNSRSSLRLIHWVCDAIQPSHPLLLLPPIPPSIRVFSKGSTLCMRWPKYWSFGFSISPSSEHPGPISFRVDWLDLLVVQGTLKSLLVILSVFFSCHIFSSHIQVYDHDLWRLLVLLFDYNLLEDTDYVSVPLLPS